MAVIVEGCHSATTKPAAGPLEPSVPAVALGTADFALVVRTHLVEPHRAQEDFVIAGTDEGRRHPVLVAGRHHLRDEVGVLIGREEVGHAEIANIPAPIRLLADDPDVAQVEEVRLQGAQAKPQFVIVPATATTERDDDIGFHYHPPHGEEESSKSLLSVDELSSAQSVPSAGTLESPAPEDWSGWAGESLLCWSDRLADSSVHSSSLLDDELLSSPGPGGGLPDEPSLDEGLSLADTSDESSSLEDSSTEGEPLSEPLGLAESSHGLSLALSESLTDESLGESLTELLSESSDGESLGDEESLSEESLDELSWLDDSLSPGESLDEALDDSSGESLPDGLLLSSLEDSSLLLLSELSSQQM